MWGLPDIVRMNIKASKGKPALEAALTTGIGPDGEIIKCEWQGDECKGSVYVYLWYDIFSDDPKGCFGLCEHHDGYYGSPDEGYFTCDGCGRVFIENYTWEMYRHDDEAGTFCLNCYRENYLADDTHWIDLAAKLPRVTDSLVRHSPHLIAVGQGTPSNLIFMGNTEFDSLDGHCISGGGNAELTELLQAAKDRGHKRAVLILDAAYQFAVSVAVYAEKSEGKQ